ncbi:MAG: hypothetical protein EOP52_03365 [Sphingobacteriales bacterium]|nr:MAG: hypothetical protein EOP52_03365 [Sphingobacteriales bacterium]
MDIQSTNQPVVPQRPTAITVICIIGAIGLVLSLFALTVDFSVLGLGAWYKPYLIISILIGAASMWGLWTMQKWGAYLYAAMFVIGQVISISTVGFQLMGFLIGGAVTAIALYYSKQMR